MTKPIIIAAAFAISLALSACDSASSFDYAAADDAAKAEYLHGKALTFVRTEAISGFNVLGGNPMAMAMLGPEVPKTEITKFNANLRTRTIHITMVVGGMHIDQSFANIGAFDGRSGSAAVNSAKQRQEKQQRACVEYAQSIFAEHDLKVTIRTMNGNRVAPGQINLNRSTCRRYMQTTT
jgi:hypothetical protein